MMTDEEIAEFAQTFLGVTYQFDRSIDTQVRNFARVIESATRERVIEECAQFVESLTNPRWYTAMRNDYESGSVRAYEKACDAIRSLSKPITPKE